MDCDREEDGMDKDADEDDEELDEDDAIAAQLDNLETFFGQLSVRAATDDE
jgi:hypothetical protein